MQLGGHAPSLRVRCSNSCEDSYMFLHGGVCNCVALNLDLLLVGRICLLNVLSVDVVTSGCR